MKQYLLTKVRLSAIFWMLLIFYSAAVYLLPRQHFTSGALALFSVNSFLYGFYIAPILGVQKARVEELHKIVRSEANAIFAMAIGMKPLPAELRNHLQDKLREYLKAVLHDHKSNGGQKKYEGLIGYCLTYEGEHKDAIAKLLDKLVANQQNRTNLSMQMNNPVFANEWSIMLVLFGITLSFVATLDAGNALVYRELAALLCTGLSMLLFILLKLSTLTHKKARRIWDPYKKLIDSHFYEIEG